MKKPTLQKRKAAGVIPLNEKHEKQRPPIAGGIQLKASVVIDQRPEICYQHWRNLENLPQFMNHLESVTVLDDRRSHWVIDAPADTTLEWDAEIIEDIENERISWRSLENAQVDNAGSVQFSSHNGGRQTLIKVALIYNPPLGMIGDALDRLFGESPDEQLADDLERFKEAVEEEG